MFPAKSFSNDLARSGSATVITGGDTIPLQGTVTGPLGQKLINSIEGLLSQIKSGRFFTVHSEEQSGSLQAACEATKILQSVIEYYAFGTIDLTDVMHEPQSRQKKLVAEEVSSRVDEVIAQVTNAGRLLQRSIVFKLLLTNVTRRVLCILRDAADKARMTDAEFHQCWLELNAQSVRRMSRVGSKESRTPPPQGAEEATHDSGDDADALEWGYSSRGSPLSSSRRGMTRKLSGEFKRQQTEPIPRRSPEVDNQWDIDRSPHTPTTDGGLLPRVTSTVTREIEKLRIGAQRPINLSKFYERSTSAVGDLLEELESVSSRLVDHAPNHIYPNEFIVTFGCSHSTLKFLTAAARFKSFFVVILEGAPRKGAMDLAESLTQHGISCRVLPDSSCFAIMGSASKVFIGTENVLANGGLLAATGTHALCLAAEYHRVPVIALAAWLKLCPYYPSDARCSSLVKISRKQAFDVTWSIYGAPQDVLPSECRFDSSPSVQVHNPAVEYVPPQLLSLIITDQGEFIPEDINRVMLDHYSAEDAYL